MLASRAALAPLSANAVLAVALTTGVSAAVLADALAVSAVALTAGVATAALAAALAADSLAAASALFKEGVARQRHAVW